MNTESLKEAFPEVYKEFFAKCSTVVSAPGSFFWSAGMSVIYGGIGVLEKIPLRAYIGIERDENKDLTFGDYIAFVPHQQRFENVFHDNIHEEKFLKLINGLCSALPEAISGKIHILSEIPRGAGLEQSGAINIALSTLMFLETGQTNHEKIFELADMKTPDVLKDPIFDKIFRMAWKFEACAHADVGSGSAPFNAFINSTSPVVFYSERRQGNFASHPHARYPSDIQGHYEVFDTIEYAGYRLKDIFGWRGDPVWPVDYGLIYLGQQKHSSVFMAPMRTIKSSLDKLEDFVVKYFKEFPSQLKQVDPAFYQMTEMNENKGYWEKSINFLIILSINAVGDLYKLVENGTIETLHEFCDTVNLQDKVVKFFTKGLSNPAGEQDLFERTIEALSHKANNGLWNIKFLPDRAGAGGDILFVSPQGYLQDQMEELQTVLRTKVSPLVRIDYMSWEDGIETKGVKIEQNFNNNHYSSFITPKMLHVTEWRNNPKPVRRVYSLEAFNQIKEEIDLLLDELEHKILVKGKALTSKEIKSAKATIEIFKILLDNLGQEVRAIDLPASCYTERNEMQSKIISPLTTTFKEITGKELPLSLHGGLRKNFSIKLDKNNLLIGLLEKRQ